mmetsp:Transcript_13059/g.16239  ORF Transcript_13059/g.16239 Transcript_13059/m.16239 type:complete len:326 (-) Transcript_13059:954-1931(-)|eukprot:CAMPEP_0204835866 /NCGR_PEP_ID=MMETSP1346-20131115/23865_1 /ASSEMBLY_ACC=CAM_ASM_000771 /TAXON_ID=215587 /ORGANISM="Aplanochytrium stocchinoi, Strain GSBS06" /LENGTH=325 /DNA_ID=CAMNT_0051970245 /DNA_START=229 /DNA_END=1206 /DNA_ORIENTATION=+
MGNENGHHNQREESYSRNGGVQVEVSKTRKLKDKFKKAFHMDSPKNHFQSLQVSDAERIVTNRREYDEAMCKTFENIQPTNWKGIVRVLTIMKAKANAAKKKVRERENQYVNVKSRSRPISADQSNLLRQRLENFRLLEVVMLGDGNCQFRSFSQELYGTPKHHGHVRQIAVTHIQNHRDEFVIYFNDEAEFWQYCNKMKNNATWGDELTLRALSNAFCVTIHVMTSTPGHGGWYLKYEPDESHKNRSTVENKEHRHAFLTYHSPIHYNVMVYNAALDVVEAKLVNSDEGSKANNYCRVRAREVQNYEKRISADAMTLFLSSYET